MPEIPDDYNVLDYIKRDELPPFELTRKAYAEMLIEIGGENRGAGHALHSGWTCA